MINIEKEIKVCDMFGGIGGFRLGLERATNNSQRKHLSKWRRSWSDSVRQRNKSDCETGETRRYGSDTISNFRTVYYCDIDKYAVSIYNKNFRENWKPTDIRTIEADSIPDFDILCGGFPCQAFSIAGKRRGFEDTRGTLFFEIARIVKIKRPSYLFLENVKGLLNHNKGKTFRTIIQTLSELGYDITWMVLNSKFFGVPQNRERVFIIGHLRGTGRPEILPFGNSPEEISGLHRETESAFKFHRANEIREHTESPTLTGNMGTGGNHRDMIANCLDSNMWKGVDPKGYYEKKKRNIVGGTRIRRLTPIECERLQGFPDNYTEGISDTQRYKCLGNAVTVNVIQSIIERWFK